MTQLKNFLSLISVLPAVALMSRGLDAPAPSATGANTRVLICHNAGPSKQIEIEVDENAVTAHVDQHGDTVGACGGSPETLSLR